MRLLFLLCAVLMAVSPASANPFPNSDPKIGKQLVEKGKCNSCHASMFGGDGSEIYTRPFRKVNTPQQLLSQLRVCNTQLGANWFPDEEEHVAAYLNQQYYKFK